MAEEGIDFVLGSTQDTRDKKEQDFSLCYAYPTVNKIEKNTVLTTNNKCPRELNKESSLTEDGLYDPENPFTYNVVRPYQLNNIKMLEYETKRKFSGKLLEIAVREIVIHNTNDQPDSIEITSVSILFKKKIICKANKPFNRKLYKLLIRSLECNNLSVEVQAHGGESSILPLPLPKRNVRDKEVNIDFAINDISGKIHPGTVTLTVSLTNHGSGQQEEQSTYFCKLSNDPNDPQNSLSLLRSHKSIRKEEVDYFLLENPSLRFDVEPNTKVLKKKQVEETKPPNIVVTEQPAFSLLDISLRNLFQARRPLRPSSGTSKHHTIRKTVLSVTVLRGVEVPVREESATVQPLVEIEWGNTTHATFVSNGPAPVWQQTMHFEMPRQTSDDCVKLRLYDQHPVWGQQWLGEARIPLEYHRNYQEFERWITMSPLFSPVLLFGYLQVSPGESRTRIYVLMKMEQPDNAKSIEVNDMNTLLKGIQRCLVTPYKITGIENPDQAAKLVMLLPSLPAHYGPLTVRQAMKIKKVDHYGRAALLAALLQGFDLQSYVLLGSSQISRWTAFVLTIGENQQHVLWDAEIGMSYNLGDSNCPLTKASRLINHIGIWENLQKSILPHDLKYNVKISKDWRPLDPVFTPTTIRTIQTLELNISEEEQKELKEKAVRLEQHLKDQLSHWRRDNSLPTIFNRHAISVLRNFVSKIETSPKRQFDKKDLKQLYRAYYIHGFVLNTRPSNPNDLAEQLKATKVHDITGPIEFALICHVQSYIGKINSIWLAVMVLKSRE